MAGPRRFPWIHFCVKLFRLTSPGERIFFAVCVLVCATGLADRYGDVVPNCPPTLGPNALLIFAATWAASAVLALLYALMVWRGRRGRAQRLVAWGRYLVSLVPNEIRLEPDPNHLWLESDKVAAATKPLIASGFNIIGVYRSTGLPSHYMFLVKPREALGAYVYRAFVRPVVAVFTFHTDGTVVAASNIGQVDVIPGNIERNDPDIDVEEMIEFVMSRRDTSKTVPLTAETLLAEFVNAVARENAWVRKHGYSARAVKRMLAQMLGRSR